MLLYAAALQYLGSKSKEQLLQEKEEEQVWKQAKQRLKLQQVGGEGYGLVSGVGRDP